jgi:hypothetical protein
MIDRLIQKTGTNKTGLIATFNRDTDKRGKLLWWPLFLRFAGSGMNQQQGFIQVNRHCLQAL